jgi:subfamily B ATP-binding cassette protein MsbA
MDKYLSSLGGGERILLIGGGIFALLVIKAILLSATVSLSAWTDGKIGHNMRCRLFRQALIVDYAELDESRQGRLVNAFDTQIYRVMDAVNAFLAIIISTCRIIVFGFLMLLASWQLTAVVLVLGLAANLLIARPIFRFVHRLGEVDVGARSAISQQVLRIVDSMRIIRVFGQENREQTHFNTLSDQIRTIFFRTMQAQQILPTTLEVVYAPIFLAAVLVAWVTGTGLTMLLAFLLLFYRVLPDIKALDYHRAEMAIFSGSVHEVAVLLGFKSKSVNRAGVISFEHLRDNIIFDKVGFHYQIETERPITLSNVSFELRARRNTAIVGESGVGKTTLINLLFGFYQPTEGRILVDGQQLVSLRMDSWRGKLALAGQDMGLLQGSIAENIAYGSPRAQFDEVTEAARLAAIHDFIMTLPRGYDTDVGENGLRLSQGQRQRVSLARALLRRPEILILDEATNALDGLTEQVINRAISSFAGNATVIIIAHRLSTVRLADYIITLSAGTVAEAGTLEELLAAGGTFARLYSAQNENAADPANLV